MLDEVARMIELDLSSIDAIAVAGGPGSFTGLPDWFGDGKRSGTRAGEADPSMCRRWTHFAYNLVGHRDMVCPLMDARRNQTYTGLYRLMETIRRCCAESAVGIDEIAADINSRGEAVVFWETVYRFLRHIWRSSLRCRISMRPHI